MPRRLPTERQAWGAGLLVAGIGVLLWLGCLFMMARLGWDLSMEVGSGGGGRSGGVQVPAGVALAILGLLGLGCVALGGLVTRNALRDIRDER